MEMKILKTNNLNIIHNSWDETYRKPFGAVKKYTLIRLFLETEGVKKAWLEIHRDFGEHDSIEMEVVQGGFEICVRITETVLYYYHFRVLTALDEVILYGNNEEQHGGRGRVISPSAPVLDYQITVYDYDDFAPLWYREGIAYHIFIDRFFVGSQSISFPKENSFIYEKKSDLPVYIKDEDGDILRWDFFGGDLWGIIEKLPYLQELGITIIYLSPIFTSRSNHRYDTGDYLSIEPMIGGEEAFEALIEEAGKLGMKLILDGVFNHCGADSIYFDQFDRHGDGAYHREDSKYRQWFHFKEDNQYDSWWGIADLPRFNGQNEELRNFLLEVVSKWSSYGIGGWRLDVADELDDEFIAQIRSCLSEDQVLLGEVWEDPTNKIAYGTRRYYIIGDYLHGVMNYPFRKSILEYVRQDINAKEAVNQFKNYLENFPPHVLYNNLNNIGTHDTMRLMTELENDAEGVKLAVFMLLMMPGVPCIYYGDEIGLAGEQDPDNRRYFQWDLIQNELHLYYKEVLKLRKEQEIHVFSDMSVMESNNMLIVIRHYEDKWIYACFNPDNEEKLLNDSDYGISETLQPKSYYLKIG